MKHYRVTGYDARGAEVFSETVEAEDPLIARLVVGAMLRRTPRGTLLINRAAEITADEIEPL